MTDQRTLQLAWSCPERVSGEEGAGGVIMLAVKVHQPAVLRDDKHRLYVRESNDTNTRDHGLLHGPSPSTKLTVEYSTSLEILHSRIEK